MMFLNASPVGPTHPGVNVRQPVPSRFELKYLITPAQAETLLHILQPLLTLDPYSQNQDDGFYPISSLYLDSQDLRLCHESLEGKKSRFKLRVRAYSDFDDAPVFFEIKRRMNAIIMKDRTKADRSQFLDFFKSMSLPSEGVTTDAMRQFQLYCHALQASPKLLIRYWRKAYLVGRDPNVRLTLDRDLSFKVMQEPRLPIQGPGWHRVPLNHLVLEIKFNGAFPSWLLDSIRRLGLQSQSVSKYTLGMRQASQLKFCAPVREVW